MRPRGLVAMAVLAAGLAACGDDDDAQSEPINDEQVVCEGYVELLADADVGRLSEDALLPSLRALAELAEGTDLQDDVARLIAATEAIVNADGQPTPDILIESAVADDSVRALCGVE